MIWCLRAVEKRDVERTFFFEQALLPEGWRRNVRIVVLGGMIDTVTADAAPMPDDERAPLVVPGMPNVHSHAFQRAMAGLTERAAPRGRDDFWSWRELMYRYLARLEADDLGAIAAYAYADMLEAGFTSVGEFHYVHRTPAGGLYADPAELALRHIAAAETTGIGITLLPVFYETGDFGGAPPTSGQQRFVTDLHTFATIIERVRAHTPHVGIAPHSLRAVTPERLGALLRLYPRENVHLHAAEQRQEVKDCIAWSGQRPVEWLLAHASVDARWCLVHATHLTPPEITGLARSGAVAGLCPVTEANLGDGTFPAVEYARAGGCWAIGTDSNIAIDAAGELRQLEYSQRVQTWSRNALAVSGQSSTGRSLLDAALAGGARALGQPVGAIAPGHRADFIALDASHPDLADRSGDAILDTWIFSGGRRLIAAVIAGGETVVAAGRHRDRDRIDAAYRRAALHTIPRSDS